VREDRANSWVIAAFGLIGLLDAYLPAYTDRKEFWTLDGDVIRWLGVVLFAAGGALADLADLRARPSPFVRGSECCLRRSLSRRWPLAYVRKRGC
jgi:protein-S-isoprenylcysteine O-methyltransferase Ste14